MASSKWKTWDELEERTEGRTVVFWGASNWIERTLDHISLDASYIVDNNENNQGVVYADLPVRAPTFLMEEPTNEMYVVITTVNYQSVIDELSALEFVMGDDYCVTPLLNERRNKDEMKALDQTVLITSPMHYSDDEIGGGVYALETRDGSVRKLYAGKARSITRAGEDILLLDMLEGLLVLDADFQVRRRIELQPNAEPHGLSYDESRGVVYIGQPGRDSIAIYSLDDGEMVDEIFVSDKWRHNKKDNHHLNDICIHESSIFVSLFSFSGQWLNEVYDGGILEISAETREIVGPVVSNLWMPHSVKRIDGRLAYLDSMRGELRNTTWSVLGEFDGFVRGLDYDGRYYYVGTSEHRYPEKLYGISNNISLDTGIYIFDPETKMSMFRPLERTESVHSVMIKTW